jgi:CheY-like chemotaxis protein
MMTPGGSAPGECGPDDPAGLIDAVGYHVRTSMNAILGALDVLLGQPGTAQQRQLAETAYASTEQLLGLVSDALDLARLSAGLIRLTEAPFSPVRLIDALVSARRAAAAPDEIDLTWEWVDGAPGTLMADAGWIRQALAALVDGALACIDAGRDLGKVRLQAEIVPVKADPDRGLRSRAFEWRIAVILTTPRSIEIEPASLLMPFPPAARAPATPRPGSGLGGTLACRLAHLLGGRVIASRAIDGSVVLALEIPVVVTSAGRALEQVPKPAAVQPMTAAPRVLLVDDNAVGRYVMRRLLEQLGIEVLSADSGESAIALVRSESIDLVLMDCLMPGMDGLMATRRIREEEPRLRRAARLPVIALTARAGADEEQLCRVAGMDGFIAKPVRLTDLRAALIRWLGADNLVRPQG